MKYSFAALTLAACLLAAGCGGGSLAGPSAGTGGAGDTGVLKVEITDAPFPFKYVESASVEIVEVKVHAVGDRRRKWQTVYEGSKTVDLLPLTGGVSELLAEAKVPNGSYDKIRLIVDAGEVVLSEDAPVRGKSNVFSTENRNLLIPFGRRRGIVIKLDTPIVVGPDAPASVLLDFDLSRNFIFIGSFRKRRGGIRWIIFRPTVRAVVKDATGTITMDVMTDNDTPALLDDDMPLAGATMRALNTDGVEVGAAMSDELGHVELSLPPGTYDLLVEATDHKAATVNTVTVVAGETTAVGEVVLESIPAGGTISIDVLSDNGTPNDDTDDVAIENATVTAFDLFTGEAFTGTTDAMGHLDLVLPESIYDVVIDADGHASAAFEFNEVTLNNVTVVGPVTLFQM